MVRRPNYADRSATWDLEASQGQPPANGPTTASTPIEPRPGVGRSLLEVGVGLASIAW